MESTDTDGAGTGADLPAGPAPRGGRGAFAVLVLAVIVLAAAGVMFAVLRPAGPSRAGAPGGGASADTSGSARLLEPLASFPATGEPALRNPIGVAVSGLRVFVAEADAGVVREFTSEGEGVRTFRLPVSTVARVVYPSDLAVVDDETLAVVDTAGSRVLLVDIASETSPVRTLGPRSGTAALERPTAVAVLDDGIAVADSRARAVRVYSTGGRLVRTLGLGAAPRLGFVGGMTLSDGRLYVSDSNAGRIVVLDPGSGVVLDVWPDKMHLPRGLASLPGARIAVAETFGARVAVETSAGTVLDASGSGLDGPRNDPRIALPKGVAWMPRAKTLFVTDGARGTVVALRLTVPGD